MKKIILLISIIFIIVQTHAQAPLVKMWDKRFGGTDNDNITCFQQTRDGGYILGGLSYSGLNGDKTQNNQGQTDFYVVKIDSLGNKEWDRVFGGTNQDLAYALQQTTDGGYILGGQSQSGISGDKTEPTKGGMDYWIVKIDSAGNKQWDKDYGGDQNEGISSLQQTPDGGYLLGGTSRSGISVDKTQISKGGEDFWIVKIDSLGIKQWDKDFGGADNDGLTSLQQTPDGGYILGGVSRSGISGDKTQISKGIDDYWIVKIDSLGTIQWDKDFGGTDYDWFNTLQRTTDDGYILGGVSFSGISGDKTEPTKGNNDYWIVKIDGSGNKEWDKGFGGDMDDFGLLDISQVADKGYLIAGCSLSGISGDKTENNLGDSQLWIVKADSLGIKQWDRTVLTNSGTSIWAEQCVLQSKDGCYVFAHSNAGGVAGDRTQPNWDTTTIGTTLDYWIIKFCDTTLVSCSSINVTTNSVTELTCYGDSNGAAKVVASGGTPPYSFLWSDGQADDSPTGFSAGTYSVTVTDVNGCTDTTSITIAEGPRFSLSNNIGGSDTIEVNQNTFYSFMPGYNGYHWSVSNGVILSGQGTYLVEVDWDSIGQNTLQVIIWEQHGCSDTLSKTITVVKGTGIHDASFNNITLHPNPTNNTLTITAAIHEQATLTLLDALGKEVWQQIVFADALKAGVQLSLKEQEQGIYFLSIRTAIGSRVMKVVKY